MNTNNSLSVSHPFLQQNENNTTSWIGKYPGVENEISKGQTFMAPLEGELENIEVYANIVTDPGEVVLSMHNFDPETNRWGPSLGSANVFFKKSDCGKWMVFTMPHLHLTKGKFYGFKLEGHDSYIGIGEAAGSYDHPPCISGKEWKFNSDKTVGDTYAYFSLAFKIGMVA